MKILHLTLKKKWFDMIASGEKKEEYREIKKYWIARLIEINSPEESPGENKNVIDNMIFDYENGHGWNDILISYYSKYKPFSHIKFKNGYSANAPTILIELNCIGVGRPKAEWSDTDYANRFILSLGKIIEKL